MPVSGTGIEQVWLEGKTAHAVLPSRAASVGQHPHAGPEQARGPVTSTGRREVIAGLWIQARNLCLIFLPSRLRPAGTTN